MKIARPKTEQYHNYQEGDCGKPLNRDAILKKDFGKNMIGINSLETYSNNIN